MEQATQSTGAFTEMDIHERIMNRLSGADRQPQAPEKPETPAKEAPEATEEPTEKNLALEDSTPPDEDTDADNAAEAASDQDVPEQSEAVEIDVADIAKLLGASDDAFDVDDDGNLLVKTKIDGKIGTAKFQDLLKSYQLEGHLNNRNMEVAEQAKALQEQQAKFVESAQSRMQQLEDSLTLANNQLNYEFQSIDWATLEQHDPAQWAALRQKYADRQGQINAAAQQLQMNRQQLHQAQLQQHEQFLNQQRLQMLNANPEWSDPAKFEQARREIRQNVQKYYGIPEEVIAGVSYAGFVEMYKDAMSYRKLQEGKPEVAKKVRQAPKIAKPGAKQETDSKKSQYTKAKAVLKKSGGKEGVRELLRLKGIA